jgi:acetolactate synthase regulatory subunit
MSPSSDHSKSIGWTLIERVLGVERHKDFQPVEMVASTNLGISTQAGAIAIKGAANLRSAICLEFQLGKMASARGPNALSVPLKIYSGR